MFFLTQNNTCVTECPISTYKEENKCIKCAPSCKKCTSFEICNECIDSLFFLENKCLENCPIYMFPNTENKCV